jgi:long-chain fatty acid transport protein
VFAFTGNHALAGGLWLYEVGSADVGLASAGYGARAQDASTVLTNPAGMTRLEGTQATLGAQLLYADLGLSISGTANTPGGGDGGNPIGWFPGAGGFISHSLSRDLKIGFGAGGNFGLAEKYDAGWAGRYYGREATLLGASLLPSVAYRVSDNLSLGASLHAMYGILKNKTSVNNAAPNFADGELELSDRKWGFGANVGILYEVDKGTRFGLVYNSQIDLDFSATATFSGVAPGLATLLAQRGLLGANVDLGIKVPQGVMASAYHAVNDRWAVLGSVGWQEWSKFGKVEVGIDSNDPRSVTSALNFKDTWHVAVGGQYRPSSTWLVNFGAAYDSEFQDSGNVSPLVPSNSQWRFGLGAQSQSTKTFNWGVAAEYVYLGNTSVDRRSALPVALGGRGDLIGTFDHSSMTFISANFNWKF